MNEKDDELHLQTVRNAMKYAIAWSLMKGRHIKCDKETKVGRGQVPLTLQSV